MKVGADAFGRCSCNVRRDGLSRTKAGPHAWVWRLRTSVGGGHGRCLHRPDCQRARNLTSMQRTSDWGFCVAKWSFFEIICNRDNWLKLFEVFPICKQRYSQNPLAKTWEFHFNVLHGPFEAPVRRRGNNSQKPSWIWERPKVWRSSVLRYIFSVESAYFLMEPVEIPLSCQACWIFWCQHQPLSEDSDSIPNFAKSLASRWRFFLPVFKFFKRINMKTRRWFVLDLKLFVQVSSEFGCQCDLSNVESLGVQRCNLRESLQTCFGFQG